MSRILERLRTADPALVHQIGLWAAWHDRLDTRRRGGQPIGHAEEQAFQAFWTDVNHQVFTTLTHDKAAS